MSAGRAGALLYVLGLMLEISFCRSPRAPTAKVANVTSPLESVRGRVVRGAETGIADAPYQVALETDKYGPICGGSIIGPEWVLTAAHCIPGKMGINVRKLSVRAGSGYRGRGGSRHAVVGGERHPRYLSAHEDYDVAVLRVSPPIPRDSGRTAVALPQPGKTPSSGTRVTVTGWGVTRRDGTEASSVLMKTSITTVSHVGCRLLYALVATITERMLCAGSLHGADACSGDSGGPLVTDDSVQVGIVSFGKSCARMRYPGVYTSVAHPDIRSFIKDATGV